MSAGYRVSSQHCRGNLEELAGTGQENDFSRDINRGILCITVRKIEIEKLGILLTNKETNDELQCASEAFTDDVNLILDGKDAGLNMQKMIKTYNKHCGATEGYVDEKTTYCT